MKVNEIAFFISDFAAVFCNVRAVMVVAFWFSRFVSCDDVVFVFHWFAVFVEFRLSYHFLNL